MSTSPPPQPPPTQGYDRPYYGSGGMPPVPPVNGELIVFLLLVLVVGIVALVSDFVDANTFVVSLIVLGAAYILSRGIAKASRVYENR